MLEQRCGLGTKSRPGVAKGFNSTGSDIPFWAKPPHRALCESPETPHHPGSPSIPCPCPRGPTWCRLYSSTGDNVPLSQILMLPSSELLAQRPLWPGQWQKAKPEILSVCPISSPAATATNGHGETHPEHPETSRTPKSPPPTGPARAPRDGEAPQPPCTVRGTGQGCDGTVKRGRGGGGDIQQADAVPRREAEEVAIAAGVAAAAAVPVRGGGQSPHPHPRPRPSLRRHRPGSPRTAPRAPGAAAKRRARRRKMSQTASLPVRPP